MGSTLPITNLPFVGSDLRSFLVETTVYVNAPQSSSVGCGCVMGSRVNADPCLYEHARTKVCK